MVGFLHLALLYYFNPKFIYMKFFKLTLFILTILSINLSLTSCSKDDDSSVSITLTQINGVHNGDGDFVGDGGSASKTFNWTNNLTTAEYNADITASATGVFQMIVKDANGTEVLNKSLSNTSPDDSISGVTSVGVAGTWTVTINVSNFNGDGSFSLSQGT